jgi:ribonuclease HIII
MPISVSIDVDELGRLRGYILAHNLKRFPTTNQYELLRIKDGEIDIVVYKTGKLVHNNSTASKEIVNFILTRERSFDYLLGSDEVGKGEWYGPLVTTAVALVPEDIIRFREIGVRDSKTLSKKELEKLAGQIIGSSTIHKSVILMPEVYNERYREFEKEGKSLNDLLAWSHAAAIKDVLGIVSTTSQKIKIIIDKFDVEKTDLRLERANIKQPNVEIIQSSKGDTEIPVSVASILAKHEFEERVDQLCKQINIDLRNSSPEEIDRKTLPLVSKTHFKNVSRLLSAI